MREAKLSRLHIGLEPGDDELKSIAQALMVWRLRGEPKRNPFLVDLNQPAV